MNKPSIHTQRNSFLSQLRIQYQQCKKQLQVYGSLKGQNDVKVFKKQKQEKTRSKSRRKKQLNCSPSRKSIRFQKCSQVNQQLLQIDKQPIWHIKRRKISERPTKLHNQIITKQISQVYKIKSTDPLYQFYSSYESVEFEEKAQQVCEKQDVNNENKLKQNNQNEGNREKNIIKQNKIADRVKMNEVQMINGRQNNQEMEMKKIMADLVQSQVDEAQLGDWKPNKMETSMLAIQKLIDEYFIFSMEMRGSQVAKLGDVTKYIRDVNGYYFSQHVLTSMLSTNPKLYKLINMKQQKYLKCGRLSQKCVERRQISTKIKMKKKQRQDQLINIGDLQRK